MPMKLTITETFFCFDQLNIKLSIFDCTMHTSITFFQVRDPSQNIK